jgi:hypothetical protein
MQCPCGGEMKTREYEPVGKRIAEITSTCAACGRCRLVVRDKHTRKIIYQKG